MNKILLVILYFFIDSISYGQTFERTYGSTENDQGNQVLTTNDCNYAIIGNYGLTGGIYLIKVDTSGNTIWQKSYDPPSIWYYHYAYSFRQTSDSGFVIASNIVYTNGTGSNICLIKTNSIGDTIWTKYYGGPSPGYYKAVAREIIITSDNGYAIIGTEVGSTNKNVFLIKTDSLGNVQWANYYGGTNDDEGYSLKQTADNGFIISGYTASFGQGGWDVYLIKVGTLGNLQWTKTYGGNRYEIANHVELTNDDGFILTGYTSGYGIGTIYDEDLFLMKTDSLGNGLWTNVYGADADEYGISVKQTNDNGFIAVGYSSEIIAEERDVYVLKTDSLGNISWAKKYGGSSTEQGNDVLQLNNSFIVVGETKNFSQGAKDVYLIRTDSIGNSSCNSDTAVTVQTILPWNQSSGGIQGNGFTVQSEIIVLGAPDTSSYNSCICIPPTANFQAYFTDACAQMWNFSTWADEWYWNFGNGDTSTMEGPSYCWWQNGMYNVCLTVTNDCGTNTFCDSVWAVNGILEKDIDKNKLNIAPNPFDNFTTVKFINFQHEKLNLVLISTIGQAILKFEDVTDDKIIIEKNNLQVGLYLILLMRGNQIIGSEKIIIN